MEPTVPQAQPGATPFPDAVCPALSVDASFKVDEGYSEETRSMDDGDSAMEMEPRNMESHKILQDPLAALYDAVAALDDPQRSGELDIQRVICFSIE